MPRKDERARRGGRGIFLVLLAGLIALLGAYFGRCLPGFGTGGSSGPPAGEQQPESEPAKKADDAKASSTTLSFTVRGDTCARGSEAAVPCATACESLSSEPDKGRPVVVNAAHGTHAAVEQLRACLEQAGFTNAVVRTE